jgi:hypothetical protein
MLDNCSFCGVPLTEENRARTNSCKECRKIESKFDADKHREERNLKRRLARRKPTRVQTCEICKKDFHTSIELQRICSSEECQKKRKAIYNKAYNKIYKGEN